MSTSPLVVYAAGAETPLSQISRIRDGFAQLPDVVVTYDVAQADLLFKNNGPYTDLICARDAGQLKPTAKLIFGVLDLPSHLLPPNGDFTFQKLQDLNTELRRADAITAISQFTQGQIQHYFALPSYVIFNPIKDVSPTKRLNGERPYPYRVLMVGRVRDGNKRQHQMGIPALMMVGFTEADVAVVGGENPGWGTNLGIVSDEVLNDLYNSVDFVMQPTLLTGFELPPIEGMVCGAIPIVCHDLTTFSELPYPRHWGCYPSATSIAYRLRMLMDHPMILQHDRSYCLTLSDGLRGSFSGKAVAARILDVYKEITKTKTS